MMTLAYPILYITRREHSHTQKYVAQQLSISPQRYQLKESGKASFTLPEARILSGLYNKSIDELFSKEIKVR
ncbi:helix-turn-helix transcriptional regulator [Staphylococcus sp. HMSC056G08]|uniref:helix-turn-helix transcriptional regulator n=1 Tax=Staphylococcus sp. HMSC056G08 TaxID=1739350 RepID=UPI0008A59AF8|nr:helix-turn-helix transcriptional regulator [Staphylococcus sp. HMSC056G08]OFJ78223.1 transcriptional regulator [Staphylococcus sp. HMSC056G08]